MTSLTEQELLALEALCIPSQHTCCGLKAGCCYCFASALLQELRDARAENALLKEESLREAAHWLELHQKAERERDDFARRCFDAGMKHERDMRTFPATVPTKEQAFAAVKDELAREQEESKP